MKKLLKSIVSFSLLVSVLVVPASGFATAKNDLVPSKIQMHEISKEEAIQRESEIVEYENAIPVTEDNRILPLSESLPYYFDFDFDSNLESQDIYNPTAGATIKIRSEASWDTLKAEKAYSAEYNYYYITLYSGSYSKRIKYEIGEDQIGTFTNVPKGDFYFYMSKPQITWSNEDIDGDISGSGKVYK